MARIPTNPDTHEAVATGDEHMVAQNSEAPAAGDGEAGVITTGADVADGQPGAVNDCAVTDQQTVLRVSVLDNDQANGQNLEIIALSQPESGNAVIAEDGSIRFSPDKAGLQEVRYVVDDGTGRTADAKASIFVNPESGQLEQPVLAALGRDELTEVARSCADGMALDIVRLAGDQIIVDPPAPGQRIQISANPGQRIDVRDETFLDPQLLRVDGGLLMIAEDGRMIFLENFVAAAENDDPVTLSIAEIGPFGGGEVLLAAIDADSAGGGDRQFASAVDGSPNPFEAEPALGPAGPSHGGGAGFSPYDPGSIGTGPDALGPLGPTALSFGVEERVLANAGDDTLGSLDDGGIVALDPDIPGDPNNPNNPGDPGNPGAPVNQAPVISVNTNISVEIGEVTVGGPTFVEAAPLPDLVERRKIAESDINGVNADNLVVGEGGDAAVIFRDEVALFQNSVGVYLIGENGEMLDPKLAFAAVEHSDEFFDENGNQQHAFIRPGGGPLSPGDQVLLSELYPGQDLPPGTKFGLFLVVDGGRAGELDGSETLEFQGSDGAAATIFDTTPPDLLANGDVVDQDVFHVIDTGSANDSSNQLNPGGGGQAISGLVADGAGLTIAFEDVRLGDGDDDFNDTVVDVLPIPAALSSLPFVTLDIAVNATIVDADDANLVKAVIDISSGAQPGDLLSFTSSLEGTGIAVSENGSAGRLVFEGTAPIETYQEILRSLQFKFGDGEGERELNFSVVDEAGNSSNTEILTLSPTNLTADIGTEGNDTLAGADDADNAIAGRGGDDNLFGADGNDIIDGGLGDDFLFGDAGDDILIGGPGADVINGGDGADEHRYFSITERGDRIEGFNAEEGDVLNFSDLLGNDSGTGNIEDFVRFDQVGNNVEVSIDVDGGGGDFGFIPYVTLVDPVGVTTVEEAASNGSVIA